MTSETKDSKESPFRGKQKEAIVRLHRLAALACEHLPAETINLASFHLAVYLDALGGFQLRDEMRAELERERASESKARTALSSADCKLLRQFGIKI